MTPTNLLTSLDTARIGEVIRDAANLPDYIRDLVGRRVIETAAYFIPRDFVGAEEVLLEFRLDVTPEKGKYRRVGIVDLAVRYPLRDSEGNQSSLWVLHDWKLVSGQKFKPEIAVRQKYDPAWIFYLDHWQQAVGPVDRQFWYRNVLLEPEDKAKKDVLELSFTWTKELWDIYQRRINNAEFLRRRYETLKGPWPQHMPSACSAYGTVCPQYTSVCKAGVVVEFPVRNTISPSGIKAMELCPERARWQAADREGLTLPALEDESEKSEAGTAFHAGMAETYRQAWERWRK